MDETRDEAIIEKMNKLEDVAAVCGCLPLAKMDTKEKFVECLCHFLVIGRAALPLQRHVFYLMYFVSAFIHILVTDNKLNKSENTTRDWSLLFLF